MYNRQGNAVNEEWSLRLSFFLQWKNNTLNIC